MIYLGDFPADQAIYFMWNTNDSDGASITRSGDGTVSVYKDNSDGSSFDQTQVTTGITNDEDVDGLTGVHSCCITTTDAWYETGHDYTVVLSASTINAQTVNVVIATFSIQNRHTAAGDAAPTVGEIRTEMEGAGTKLTLALEDTSELQGNQAAWATATGFSTHSAANVWAVAARTLTANTNFNDLDAAAIKAEVVAALADIKLDHLLNIAVDTNWATTVHLDSVIGHMADVGTAATFSRTTDSMEALRNRGDAGWITATGFSTHNAAAVKTAVEAVGSSIAQILADTDNLQGNQAAWATATGFSTHSAADVWSVAARVLTANTNFNDLDAAAIKSEVVAALADIKLDHLLNIAVDTNWATTVHLDSVIGHMADVGGAATYDRANESMEALRARGDAAWISATGFSTHSAADVKTAMEAAGSKLTLTLEDTANLQGNQAAWATATGFSTHSAADVKTSVEQAGSSIAQILADTNEMELDLKDGGRLDLILDIIAADTTTDIPAKVLKYIQLIARSDAAIATDNASELTAINADGGSGAGDFSNQTDAEEAIRDRGDAAWSAAAGTPSVLIDTTINVATDQTHFTLVAGSDVDDAYKDQAVVIYDVTNSDFPSVRKCTAYTGATKTITLDSAPDFTIAAADKVKVFVTAPGTSAPSVGEIRTEMEGAGTKLTLALEDTDELQGNQSAWATATGFSTHSAADVWTSATRALTDKAGFALSATGANLILKDSTFALAMADAIWDEILTGATHNIATSAGRRVREIGAFAISSGTAQAGNSHTITIAAAATPANAIYDGIFNRNLIVLTDNTGVGQTRTIVDYDAVSKVIVVDRDWRISPDATTEYQITPDDTPLTVDHGVAISATATTIKIRPYASSVDDAYLCNIITIIAGKGRGQARLVGGYVGSTNVVTICGDDWVEIPDATSVYVMMPYGVACAACVGDTAATQIKTVFATALADVNLDTHDQNIKAILFSELV